MVVRVGVLACTGALAVGSVAGCTYTKKDSDVSAASTIVTVAVVPSSSAAPVVGTLPPITVAPPTVPPPSTIAPATTDTAAPPPTADPSPRTTAPKTGTAIVQAGSFSTPQAAQAQIGMLAAAGFGGFSVVGQGPYRVQRGGLSAIAAASLVAALAAKGFNAFSR